MANETMLDMNSLSEANETLNFIQSLNRQSKNDMLVLYTGVKIGVVMALDQKQQEQKPA